MNISYDQYSELICYKIAFHIVQKCPWWQKLMPLPKIEKLWSSNCDGWIFHVSYNGIVYSKAVDEIMGSYPRAGVKK